MSGGYAFTNSNASAVNAASFKTDYESSLSKIPNSSAAARKMVLSDKDIANLYENIDRLDNGIPKNTLANRKLLVCGKILANNKQKQCENEEEVDGESGAVVVESTMKAENLKYSSMCLNNPFAENPEYGRNGEERKHSVRLLCDNNRNQKDSFPLTTRKWNVSASQDADINENFAEPAIHHKINLLYQTEGSPQSMANNKAAPYNHGGGDQQDTERPKRPQSISVLGGNQRGLNAEPRFSVENQLPSGFNRDQFTSFNNNTRTSVTANGRMLDLTSMGFSVFKVGPTLASNAATDQRTILRGAPIVPHRRSQSTPRHVHGNHPHILTTSSNATTAAAIGNVVSPSVGAAGNEQRKRPELRPKSLDRGVAYLDNVNVQMHSPLYNQLSGQNSPKEIHNLGNMKNSASFHGQFLPETLNNGELGNGTTSRGRPMDGGIRKPNRPLSYTYGSEQAFLENQLRIYSEQLKSITESVRKYSEKAKQLSELKRQEMLNKKTNGYSMPTSKSDSKLSAISIATPNPPLNEAHKQTSSHQLRLFLEDIRNNIRDSTPMTVDCTSSATGEHKADMENATERCKTSPEQQPPPPIPQRKRQTLKDNSNSAQVSNVEAEGKPDSSAPGNQLLSSAPKTLQSNELDFNQILDNFNFASKQFSGNNRAEYLEDYLTAMRRTSNEIRQAALTMKQGNLSQDPSNGCSSDENSSTSTTPGSIREAVQSLLAMPRNGVQVMDDRMRLFIDILDTQDKFSQVDAVLFLSSLWWLRVPHSIVSQPMWFNFEEPQFNIID